jgi:hypothetical protein
MSARRCTACRVALPATAPGFVTLCRPCFIESKKQEHAALVDEVLELRSEVARLRRERQCIEPEMIARLIRLAHPDRHANSRAANEATAWLLSLREVANA